MNTKEHDNYSGRKLRTMDGTKVGYLEGTDRIMVVRHMEKPFGLYYSKRIHRGHHNRCRRGCPESKNSRISVRHVWWNDAGIGCFGGVFAVPMGQVVRDAPVFLPRFLYGLVEEFAAGRDIGAL